MKRRFIRRSNDKDNVYDYMVKLILLGDSGVGKTNILTRFCDNVFKDAHVATIGVDFSVRTIQVEDKKLKLQVWDTAGQERFRTITETYYKGAYGIILAYAVDSRQSFENVQKWMKQVNQRTTSSTKKILIANKIDVDESNRVVTTQQGIELGSKYNMSYMEVSAKKNINIQDLFMSLGSMIKNQMESQSKELDSLTRTITLNSKKRGQFFREAKNVETWSCFC